MTKLSGMSPSMVTKVMVDRIALNLVVRMMVATTVEAIKIIDVSDLMACFFAAVSNRSGRRNVADFFASPIFHVAVIFGHRQMPLGRGPEKGHIRTERGIRSERMKEREFGACLVSIGICVLGS